MIQFNTLEEINILQSTGVALGTFDGIHVGHRVVLEKLLVSCKKKGLKSLLFTFSNHPREVTHDFKNSTRIISVQDKIREIEKLGFDYLVMIDFNDKIKNIEAEDFIEKVIIEKFNAELVVVGYNFKFGRHARGHVDLLKKYNDIFELEVISKISIDNLNAVSSSAIRDYITKGDIVEANKLLGRPYRLTGLVQTGRKVGRNLGFPTANLVISIEMTILKPGVYVTNTYVGNIKYQSVTNVGMNPTFNCDEGAFNIETHLLDFNGDLYDKIIEVEFVERLRDEIRFDSIDKLIEQITNDVEMAKSVLYKL